jgi:hypothetical protein
MDYELPQKLAEIFENLTDSQAQRSLIESYGLFMSTWSILENVIQAAVKKELNLDAKKTVIVTGKLQFNPRLQILISLLKLKGESGEVIKLLSKIESYAQRNVLVHGIIIVNNPQCLTFAKFDGGASIKRTFYAADFVKHNLGLANHIEKIQNLLNIDDSDLNVIGQATLDLASSS